jgi:hypothetical protein
MKHQRWLSSRFLLEFYTYIIFTYRESHILYYYNI